MEADEIDLFAAAVFSDFEQVDDAEKTGFAGKLGCDVGEADGLDRIHFDFTFFHGVAPAGFCAWAFPDANAARDVSAANTVTEAPGEHHGREFTAVRGRPSRPGGLSVNLRPVEQHVLPMVTSERAVADGMCQETDDMSKASEHCWKEPATRTDYINH